MVHLLLLIDAPTKYNFERGSHYEELLKKIDTTKLELNKFRKGYNRPFSSEIHFLNYRIKEQCLSDMLGRLGGIILNPEHNKIRLIDIIKPKKKGEKKKSFMYSTNKGLLLIQWFFKWFNLLRINKLFGLYPVPTPQPNKQKYSEYWAYKLIFGVLKDPRDKEGEELL